MGKILNIIGVSVLVLIVFGYFFVNWIFESLGGWAWLLIFGIVLLVIALSIFLGPELLALGAVGVEVAGTAAEAAATAKMLGGKQPPAQHAGTNLPSGYTPPPAPRAPPEPWDLAKIKRTITELVIVAALGYAGFYFTGIIGLQLWIRLLIILGSVGLIILHLTRGTPVSAALLRLITITALAALFFGAFIFLSTPWPHITMSAFLAIFLLMFTFKSHKTRGDNSLAFFALIYLCLSTIILATTLPDKFVQPSSPIAKSLTLQKKAITNLPQLINRGQQQVQQTIQRKILIATGDYEQGVQAQSQQANGVYLENVGLVSADAPVPTTGIIDMYARLNYSTYKTKTPLMAQLSCTSGNVTGDIQPKTFATPFPLLGNEQIDLDCTIPALQLGVGNPIIALAATFDFSTSAYRQTIFIDQEEDRTLRRQGADPLTEFNIGPDQVKSGYTPGPMSIGMGVGQQPIRIPAEAEQQSEIPYGPTLQITIDKAPDWTEGKLQNVSQLEIIAPPGLAIIGINGYAIKKETCTINDKLEDACLFTGPDLANYFPATQLQGPRTLRVQTGIISSTKLLEGNVLAIRSFKVNLKYTYVIQKQAQVTIIDVRPIQPLQPPLGGG